MRGIFVIQIEHNIELPQELEESLRKNAIVDPLLAQVPTDFGVGSCSFVTDDGTLCSVYL